MVISQPPAKEESKIVTAPIKPPEIKSVSSTPATQQTTSLFSFNTPTQPTPQSSSLFNLSGLTKPSSSSSISSLGQINPPTDSVKLPQPASQPTLLLSKPSEQSAKPSVSSTSLASQSTQPVVEKPPEEPQKRTYNLYYYSGFRLDSLENTKATIS